MWSLEANMDAGRAERRVLRQAIGRQMIRINQGDNYRDKLQKPKEDEDIGCSFSSEGVKLMKQDINQANRYFTSKQRHMVQTLLRDVYLLRRRSHNHN